MTRFEEVLISEVRKRPCLWDKHCVHYKNRHKKSAGWQAVSKEINVPEEEVKKRWKNLTDYFRTELKKIPKPRSGDSQDSAPIYRGKWEYFPLMTFMTGAVTHRPTEGNLVEEETEVPKTYYSIPVDEDVMSFETIDSQIEPNPIPDEEIVEPEEVQTRPVKKKTKTLTAFEERLLELESSKIEALKQTSTAKIEDEDSEFFNSLLPHVRRIDGAKKLKLRGDIIALVLAATTE